MPDIFKDFEPPSKTFLATLLQLPNHFFIANNLSIMHEERRSGFKNCRENYFNAALFTRSLLINCNSVLLFLAPYKVISWSCSIKNLSLRISKLSALGSLIQQLYYKRDPSISDFLWVLQSFKEYLFCRILTTDSSAASRVFLSISLFWR